MPTPQVEGFIKLIKDALPNWGSLDEAVTAVILNTESIFGTLSEEQLSQIEEARQSFLSDPIDILQKQSIFLPHQKWYFGTGNNARHWPALHNFVAFSKDWGEETANSIGREADEVVSLLANPASSSFQYRGLVVGYVQSGKTANMTAVMAKAIDEGYNMIVVLAGLTNKLRKQTQSRIEKDLVERHPGRWHRWTNTEDSGDFQMPAGSSFLPGNPNLTQLCVLKKNVSPLRKFLETAERTLPAITKSLRVLLIDDECDSASVNASNDEMNISAINRYIRTIIRKFPAITYTGYTATPFANVFINPYADAAHQNLDDLYPRNFITALQRPPGYFGAEQLFGVEPLDANDPSPLEEGLDMIRPIRNNGENNEIPLLQPASRNDKDSFYPQMTDSLERALLYFIGACAARFARGQDREHMTMLVHTSVYTILHQKFADLILKWLGDNQRGLKNQEGSAYQKLKTLWGEESGRVSLDGISSNAEIFEALAPFIETVLDKIEVPVENGFSDDEDRIDYEGEQKIYIVVGGTVLSRGLTLEGLIVSFFLRSTTQYDTLLQMGRWFGHRRGYEDLPRIWMTEDLKIFFRSLATIEHEIREEILNYSEQNVNPMGFAVRVRSIPGMAITAANKMRHAHTCDISYSGEHRQTIRFNHRDASIVESNWRAGSDLLSTASEQGVSLNNSDKVVYCQVPAFAVQKFFRDYKVHEDHKELSAEFLTRYIDEQAAQLSHWNVGLVQPGSGRQSSKSLGPIRAPRLSRRARLDDKKDNFADIKALMSKKDVLMDCEKEYPTGHKQGWREFKQFRRATIGDIPLLLLYTIERLSEPSDSGSKARVALDAVDDLLGFGVVFPGSEGGAGGFMSVRLEVPSVDELESLDEEIDQQLEAGHAV